MPVFESRYEVAAVPMVTCIIPAMGTFDLENRVYSWIKKRANGFRFDRIDTTDQRGFPDILLRKGPSYILIEAKILRKKALVDLAKDISWQPGQYASMVRSLINREPYVLAVAYDKHVALIFGEYIYGTPDHSHIIELC